MEQGLPAGQLAEDPEGARPGGAFGRAGRRGVVSLVVVYECEVAARLAVVRSAVAPTKDQRERRVPAVRLRPFVPETRDCATKDRNVVNGAAATLDAGRFTPLTYHCRYKCSG
ncbi:MAG: hypothetical protein U0587_08880 [Candidatus Binatia bacterium]